MNREPCDQPHPLARRLGEIAREAPALLVGIGNGRNLPPLLTAETGVIGVDENAARVDAVMRHPRLRVVRADYTSLPFGDAAFGAALSTHALQHGTRAHVAAIVAECARVCRAAAPFYAVFASVNDARYGTGSRIEDDCYAAEDGDEAGVPHLYVDTDGVRDLLEPSFELLACDEQDASRTAGRWAHTATTAGLRHYFVIARRRATEPARDVRHAHASLTVRNPWKGACPCRRSPSFATLFSR